MYEGASCHLQLYRLIPLTQGKWATVDADDYGELSEHRWYAYKDKATGGFYALRNVPRGDVRTTVRMHRQIMDFPPGLVVDHENFDGLHNRRYNLRTTTRRLNVCHQRKQSRKTSSKFKGVSLHSPGRWASYIKVHQKKLHLGLRGTEEEAARLYDAAALEHFGQFAELNFPAEVAN